MKEELEIKHLKGYLGYGLKGMVKGFKTPVELTGLLQNDIHICCPIDGFDYVDYDMFKPILRPLSDLTKEIEHNGDKFVPIDKLNDLYGYTEVKLTHYLNDGLGWSIDWSLTNTAIVFEDMYLPIEKLYEWRFDVHDLISKGLAIDINSLD